MARPKSTIETEQVTANLPQDLVDKLKAEAQETCRPYKSIIFEALTERYENA